MSIMDISSMNKILAQTQFNDQFFKILDTFVILVIVEVLVVLVELVVVVLE